MPKAVSKKTKQAPVKPVKEKKKIEENKEKINFKYLEEIKIKKNELIEGDYLSNYAYLKVVSIDNNTNMVQVKGKEGLEYQIEKDVLEIECQSGSYFKYTVHLPLTKIIEILENVGTELFTVSFDKAQTDDNIINTIESFTFEELTKDKNLKLISKNITKGDECVITGYLSLSESYLGRSAMHDIRYNYPISYRIIDHRTINYLIYRGVKYIKK